MKEALLILGAGTDQLFMIKTAKSMGVITVAVDANKNAPGLKIADHSRPIDFNDTEKVIDYCKQLIDKKINLSGVSTMGSDIPDIIYKVADYFGWACHSEETSVWAKHKFKMKVRCASQGIPIPRFSLVETPRDIRNLWNKWKSDKLIIKPTDRAGSRGIKIIEKPSQIETFLNYALKHSFNKDILLEEFVAGRQISTETIAYDSQYVTPGFADRVYENMECFHPNIMENGGWLPSSLNEKDKKEIVNLVEDSAKALRISYGVAKGDVVICPKRGPMMIEMAARLSGGDFSESLVPLSSGINYVKTVIEISLGKKPTLNDLMGDEKQYVANRYLFPPQGVLQEIRGLDKIKLLQGLYKIEIYVKPGDKIPNIDSHNKRAGVFVIQGENKEIVQSKIDHVYDLLEFKINGNWTKLSPCKV